MGKYRRPAALVAIMIGGIYGILLIAAAAAPAPAGSDKQAASSVVADQLKADAARLSGSEDRSNAGRQPTNSTRGAP